MYRVRILVMSGLLLCVLFGGAEATPMPYEDFAQSLSITVPPLAVLFFKPE